MNERIKELAEQAEQYAYRVAVGGDECQEAYTKKFAELIVKKCADIVQFLQDHGREDIADDLKKHFGVE